MPKRTPSGGDGRDWAAYHASQVNEKKLIPLLLHELCKEIEEPERVMGRRPFLRKDMLVCMILKVYSDRSSCRFVEDLYQVQAEGLIEEVPSPNTISERMREEALTSVLQHLITKSSLPLAEVEKVFAVDSTGFSVPGRRDWFNRHTGKHEKRRSYMKFHAMIGVGSNIITCAEPTEWHASDRNYLRLLVEGTARYFEITEVSADAGYMSGENMRAVLLAGAIPYIAFTKSCVIDADYKSDIWKDLLYLYKTRHPQFTDHYYLRNNVESLFSSIKAKFSGRLRSKSERGQFNEALCKAICHNLCTLIHSMYSRGIDPTSWSKAQLRPEAETGLTGAGLKNREQDLANIRIAAAGRREITTPKAVVSIPQPKEPERKRYAPAQSYLFEVV
jgi:transposase